MPETDFSPKVVLAIAAHPDDVDFGFSGSIAKWAKSGSKVYYLLITDGSKGTEDRTITAATLIKKREAEQRVAAKLLGARDVFFLGYPDSELEMSLALKKEVTRYIRKLKPDTVLGMDPSMIYSTSRGSGFINHSDHRVAGQVMLDAVFPLARDHLTFPDLLAEGLEPHKVSTVLMVNFEKNDFAVDISDTIDKKLEALALHTSQMPDIDAVKDRIRSWSKIAGKKYGYDYAEAFVRLDLS
ncbi:MAG: PIG-L deacetylase family protein [Candidatus Saccharimonadales bacterium]